MVTTHLPILWNIDQETVKANRAGGFLYRITHKDTGKYYIGMKTFGKAGHTWMKYTTSSKLSAAIIQDPEAFTYSILDVYPSKNLLKYYETLHILLSLPDPQCGNEMVNIRTRFSPGMKKMYFYNNIK